MGHFRALGGPAILLLWSACSSSSTYNDNGFTVNLPAGWTAHKDSSTGQIELSGKEGRIRILPVFSPRPLEARLAGPSLLQAANRLWSDVQWTGRVEPAGATALRMSGLTASGKALASFAWVSTPAGTAGCLYRIDTARAAGEAVASKLAGILATFRITGSGSGAAPKKPAAPQYARWTDPRENAFTIEPPAGWKVEGGLFRNSPVDTRMVWRLESPDGAIHVMGGDPQLPVFTVPNQMLAFAGFPEGAWYSPGYGHRMLVRRFLDGASFAREYAATRVSQTCANVTVTGGKPRPDLEEALTRIERAYGFPSRLTMGEATFTCTLNNRAMTGYILAGTRLTGPPETAIWNAEHLIGYLAAPGRDAAARQAMEHVVATAQINPQWAAGQQHLTASVSKIVSQTNTEISRIINEGYVERHRNDDEMSRRRSNATLGVVDAVDPQTGQPYRLESGSDYYWIDNQGRIAGTRTDTNPGIDFRQLVVLP